MIQLSMLTSVIRRTGPFALVLPGVVCPGTPIFGVYDAGGRTP